MNTSELTVTAKLGALGYSDADRPGGPRAHAR